MLRVCAAASFLLLIAIAVAQSPAVRPMLGHVVRLDPRIDKLIPKDAVIEVLASGISWAEGPLWIKDGG